jgi:hypothetical protein
MKTVFVPRVGGLVKRGARARGQAHAGAPAGDARAGGDAGARAGGDAEPEASGQTKVRPPAPLAAHAAPRRV